MPHLHPPRRGPADPRQGFTLLEVMVALAILGTAVAALLSLLAAGTGLQHRAEVRVLAAELADERLQALVLDGEAAVGQGAFPPPHAAFRWNARRARGPVDGTVLAEVVVVGTGDSVHLATVHRP